MYNIIFYACTGGFSLFGIMQTMIREKLQGFMSAEEMSDGDFSLKKQIIGIVAVETRLKGKATAD